METVREVKRGREVYNIQDIVSDMDYLFLTPMKDSISYRDETVMDDEPGIPVHRIPPQNLVIRLFHREIHKISHYQAHANRSFYQNINPNFTVTNVQKPPCFLRKFSPDGRQVYENFYTQLSVFSG